MRQELFLGTPTNHEIATGQMYKPRWRSFFSSPMSDLETVCDEGVSRVLTCPESRAHESNMVRRSCLQPNTRRSVVDLQLVRRRCAIRKDYLPRRNRRLAFEELEALRLLSVAPPLTAGSLTPPHGTGGPIVTTLVGTSGGLSGPTDSTYYNGALYVPNTNTNTISEVTPAGVVSTYVDSTKGLNTPDGLTFDSAGNLYIANFHGETISKVTPGGTVTTFADVNSPNSPVFGPNGDLYVCDKYDGTIVEITPAGVVSTFVDNTHGLSYPIALAFDDSGNLYVDSQNNSTIYKVTAAGSVSVLASGGLINSPTDMVFGPGGNLYVYNSGTSAITEVTPAGVVSNFLTLDSAVAGTYAGLVFDSAGDLYVINNGNNTISKIAPATLVEGQPVTDQTVFHFTDANPDGTASQYTAVVTLGDGNTVTLSSSGVVGIGPAGAGGQIVADPGGGFDVQLSYTYAEAFSNQTFGVQVTDEGGATTGASTNNFSVADVPLTAGSLTPPHGTGRRHHVCRHERGAQRSDRLDLLQWGPLRPQHQHQHDLRGDAGGSRLDLRR